LGLVLVYFCGRRRILTYFPPIFCDKKLTKSEEKNKKERKTARSKTSAKLPAPRPPSM
jgi:hypothetical protein